MLTNLLHLLLPMQSGIHWPWASAADIQQHTAHTGNSGWKEQHITSCKKSQVVSAEVQFSKLGFTGIKGEEFWILKKCYASDTTLSEHLNMPSFSIYEWKLSSVWIYLPEPVFLSSYSIVSITFTNTNHTLIRCAADKMLFAFFLPISLFLESLMVALSHNTKSNLSNI